MNARAELCEYGRKLLTAGLVVGPGGNISAREGDAIYISPSGYAFDECDEDDYVKLRISDGARLSGDKRPSSEWMMHLECYRRRPDIGAVIHAHPTHATGLVTGGAKLRPMTPDFVAYVGDTLMIPYIVPTGKELASAVGEAITACSAILMINHGAITVGATLRQAYVRMAIIEDAAKLQLAAIAAGEPRFLSADEIEGIKNLAAEAYRRKVLEEK